MRRQARSQQGQVLLVTALLIPIMLGMAALAVDIGTYAGERRTLQNAADSIALAGARGLPDPTSANTLANEWAAKNNIDTTDMTVSVVGGSTSPTVRVTITRPHEFSFIRALGITEKDVSAVAAAQKLSLVTGTGIVPWSITQNTVDTSLPGEEVIIKYDSNLPGDDYGQGNFGIISVDGSGASEYEDAAMYGSDSNICASGTPGCTTAECPGTYPTTCAENAPECDGNECLPKTGNVTGSTKDAIDFRMTYTSAECDTFEEAFTELSAAHEELLDRFVTTAGGAPRHHGSGTHPTYTPTATPTRTNTPLPTDTPTQTSTPLPPTASNTPLPPTATDTPGGPTDTPTPVPPASATPTPGSPGTGLFGLNPDCNPWSGGACPPAPSTDLCSRRVFLIPIVEAFGNGSSDPLVVTGFALVYLEGYDGTCTGSSCDVRARFVRADITTGGITGAYDPNAAVHVVKLSE
jgi:hypothetical protein